MGRKTRELLARLESPPTNNPWQIDEWNRVKQFIENERKRTDIDLSKRKGRRFAKRLLSSDTNITDSEANQYVKLLREKEKQNQQALDQRNQQAYYNDLYNRYQKGLYGELSDEDARQVQLELQDSNNREALRELINMRRNENIVEDVRPIEERSPYLLDANKRSYIRWLNGLQSRNELEFQGVKGQNVDIQVTDENIEGRGLSKKQNLDIIPKANKKSYDNATQQRIANIEYAINSGDLSNFYDDPRYFKKRKDFESDQDFYTWLPVLANQAVVHFGEINYPIPYRNNTTMSLQRLKDLRQVSPEDHKDLDPALSIKNTPIDEHDILWLQLAPEHRTQIINNLQRELKKLKGID